MRKLWAFVRNRVMAAPPVDRAWEQQRAAAFSDGGLLGIAAVGSHEVWAVGRRAVVSRWDGARWHDLELPHGPMTDVAGIVPSNVWFTGSPRAGLLTRWDGCAFTSIPAPGPGHLCFPDDKDGAFAVRDGAILWWDGGAWQDFPTPFPARVAAVRSATDVWVTSVVGGESLAHWDGSSWTTVEIPCPIRGVRLDGDDVWIHPLERRSPLRRTENGWAPTERASTEAWSGQIGTDERGRTWLVNRRAVLLLVGDTWAEICSDDGHRGAAVLSPATSTVFKIDSSGQLMARNL